MKEEMSWKICKRLANTWKKWKKGKFSSIIDTNCESQACFTLTVQIWNWMILTFVWSLGRPSNGTEKESSQSNLCELLESWILIPSRQLSIWAPQGKIACQVEEASGQIRFWFLSQVNIGKFHILATQIGCSSVGEIGKDSNSSVQLLHLVSWDSAWNLNTFLPLGMLNIYHNTTQHIVNLVRHQILLNSKLLHVTQNVSYFVFILSLPSSSFKP